MAKARTEHCLIQPQSLLQNQEVYLAQFFTGFDEFPMCVDIFQSVYDNMYGIHVK